MIYAILALLYALVGQQLFATVGQPYAIAVQQINRIEATNQILRGMEDRNLLSLQEGLTKAAELPKFNETLFEEGKKVLRVLRERLDALAAAVEQGEPRALAGALADAIEVLDDGRPIVDRYHLRSAAKKLQEVEKVSIVAFAETGRSADGEQLQADLVALYGRVKDAIALTSGRHHLKRCTRGHLPTRREFERRGSPLHHTCGHVMPYYASVCFCHLHSNSRLVVAACTHLASQHRLCCQFSVHSCSRLRSSCARRYSHVLLVYL